MTFFRGGGALILLASNGAESSAATLIGALVQLLWVLLAAYVAWKLLPSIIAVVDKRDVYVEIGGMKVKLAKALEQVQSQGQGLTMDVLKGPGAEPATLRNAAPASAAKLEESPRRILWVDDNPTNNAFCMKQLRESGIDIVFARSTREAREILKNTRVRAVISDIHRIEDGIEAPTAGLELARLLREEDDKLPVMFFTSTDAARRNEAAAREVGALGITSSAVELFRMLETVGVRIGERV